MHDHYAKRPLADVSDSGLLASGVTCALPYCLPMLASNFGNAASFLGLWPLGFPPGIHHVSPQPRFFEPCRRSTVAAVQIQQGHPRHPSLSTKSRQPRISLLRRLPGRRNATSDAILHALRLAHTRPVIPANDLLKSVCVLSSMSDIL
ncbi:hypothetical protein BD311DRAFT_335118 [Dichomitus squalens]|uniref:Uncharacterized protein n=1 Tax=Dichomitus squalens TaxID=114155 RepID=A0A4Q9ML10_9APHY|nr:hypothetical protein BD311DRAFT_335118 [Dichomitus squalens]